ncbi:MAG: prepilin peptidase [Candidatus Woesearchaeota archaeon]
MELGLINLIVLFGLMFASYKDFKKREVPDYLNFSMIILGIMFGLIGAIYFKNYWILLSSILGLGVGYLFGALMFYTGQWGGGDAKMVMAIGALHGFNIYNWIKFGEFPLLLIIFFTIIFAGSFYGLIYMIVLVFKNFKEVKKEFNLKIHEKNIIVIRKIVLIFVCLFCLLALFLNDFIFRFTFIGLAIIIFLGNYLIIFGKVIEKVCMVKKVDVSKLTEGDWILNDIVVKGKTICGPKDLGISLKQISKLKKLKVKEVIIKEGIPFIPGFLLGYILILIFGNWILYFI